MHITVMENPIAVTITSLLIVMLLLLDSI